MQQKQNKKSKPFSAKNIESQKQNKPMTNLSPSLFTDDMGVCAAEAMNPLGCPGLLPAWSLKMLFCLVLVFLHIYHT